LKDHRERKKKKQEPTEYSGKESEKLPGERNLGLGDREIAGSTARADLGNSGIDMEFGAKFDVIASTAEITEVGFTSGRMSACIAIFHGDYWI
jgi:hypothetical protein